MDNPQGNTVSEVGASTEELIARLEQASGPDWDIDCAIDATLPHPSTNPPRYSASIDAALTLVPEGEPWSCGCDVDLTPLARIGGPTSPGMAEVAANPAIALCIAALKARVPAAHG